MKLGAERKKVAILAALVLVGLYFFYTNVLSDSSGTARSSRTAAVSATLPATSTNPAGLTSPGPSSGPSLRRYGNNRASSQDFRPSLKPRRPEDRPDPTTIDPTLRLDLLAKVQAVELEGGSRNLFQFGAAPPPPVEQAKLKETIIHPKTPEQIAEEQKKIAEAAKPSAPPITLKYYGYSALKADGKKRAFFLDGEDIFIAAEGEVVKRRYRIVRIGVNSVVMEDTEFKIEQTVPLQQEAAAG
jgi:hypothetical protein